MELRGAPGRPVEAASLPLSTNAPVDDRLLFVGGLHHSGTSLLARLLRQHPEISGFFRTGVPEDEGQHLQDVIPTAAALGGPGRFGLHPEGPMDERSPLATPENGARIQERWIPHWDMGCPILLEKSPPNLIRTRFLQRLFPGARFLLIVRHPVAVAYGTRGLRGPSLRSLMTHWSACHRRALDDLSRLDRARIVRFEDLVLRPGEVLDDLFRWLDLEPADNVVQVRGDANRRHMDRWERLRRSPLTRGLAGRLIREFAAPVATLDYRLK